MSNLETALTLLRANTVDDGSIVEKPPVEHLPTSGAVKDIINSPDETAPFPNPLTRVGLFFVMAKNATRRVLKYEKLSSRGDVEVFFSGEELDRRDGDVYLACLRMGKGIKLGDKIEFTQAEMLRELGRADSGQSRRWLARPARLEGITNAPSGAMDRLAEARLSIVLRKKNGHHEKIKCGLITYGLDDETGKMFFRLDPESAKLFKSIAYIDWERYLSFTSLAKALHVYISGHKVGKAHTVPLMELKGQCGYRGELRFFESAILEALKEIEAAGIIKLKDMPIFGKKVSWERVS